MHTLQCLRELLLRGTSDLTAVDCQPSVSGGKQMSNTVYTVLYISEFDIYRLIRQQTDQQS